MVPSIARRRLLRTVGSIALGGLAGCTAPDVFGADGTEHEYTLTVDAVETSPVEYALYSPDDDPLFGAPARETLANILPDGRHTTYGYQPVTEDEYVEHDGRYFQTAVIVTGSDDIDRTLVRAEPLADDATVPDDAVPVDSLDRPSARVVKILHSHAQTGGESDSDDLLRNGAYVLRRPAERESPLSAGDLDGRVVTMQSGGPWNYRIETATRRISETAYTTLALEVAASREQFREVVFDTRIDADLTQESVSADVQSTLDRAIGRGRYVETTPLSPSFETLLERLDLGSVDSGVNGQLLWYDASLYRYGLYISDASGD
ncbi:hypothetical protein NDI54_02905 [Haloarcula sp. S1AR25-5A]|uniref:Uncharacterized protein n=1 Tax=Haloarcula terrestris TaxID=2950533 RepID=A0AAE4JG85_9EURY|nr:hypothetical protein [Haloarcula terrestris]MDS0220295.1 hypothetical protein [Haloarcula terrestris]